MSSGLAERAISLAIERGVAHRTIEEIDGRTIRLDGRDLIHFGSCSYLGLELDPRLIEAGVRALRRYGSYLSCSRAYAGLPLYRELEERMGRIFKAPVVIAPTTTLAHLAALPALVHRRDAVLLDREVHHSVQMTARLLRGSGSHIETIPHNDLGRLDERVRALQGRHRRVWYMADGVYSMNGDLAPVPELYGLQARHPQLYLYFDDAHGMSWTGERGSGYVCAHGPLPERTILAVSLAKGFGSCGGVLVFADAEFQRRVRVLGATVMFGGPIAPSQLGASIASADIHLSSELPGLQERLRGLIELCDQLLAEAGVPVACDAPVPTRFVPVGDFEATVELTSRLADDGFFASAGIPPAVPPRRSGLRLALTLHHTEADLRAMIAAIARHLPEVGARSGRAV